MKRREFQGKRLLILGASKSEIEIVKTAQEMGVFVIVTDNHANRSDAPAKLAADEAWDISWSDFGALEKQCRLREVDGVMAGFSERRVACAQKLSQILELPFYADGADLPKIQNKILFREACVAAGVDAVCSYSRDNACFPVIVKPADNGGSRGITICYSQDELDAACDKALASSDSELLDIEEYIVADEVMVYYVVHGGCATLSAMCDRYMHSFDPSITQLPVGYRFPSKHLALFEDRHDARFQKLIRELGINDGLIAFQCLVKDGRVIPFDPTYRLDGTMAYRATEKVNGSNVLMMLIRHSLSGSMGSDDSISLKENPYFGKMCFELPILLGRGTICDIRGLEEAKSVDGVYFVEQKARIGDNMPDIAAFSQMLCRIQMVAEDEETLLSQLRRIFDYVDVLDENGTSMVLYRDAISLAAGEVKRCAWQ